MSKQPLSAIAEINPPLPRHVHDAELVSFVGMSDVKESGGTTSLRDVPFEAVKTGFTRFAEGDVLFAKITPCMENGKGALAAGLTNGIGCGSTEFHVLRAKGENCNGFIYQVVQSPTFRQKAEMNMSGSAGQQRVPSDFFKEFPVHIPAPPQQRRIAEILSTLDEAIEQTEALIAKMQQVKAGLMHDLFTRGVTPAGRLRPTREQAPGFYKESPLGWIPREWEIAKIGDVIDGIEQGWSPDCESEVATDQEWGVLKTSAVVWEGFVRSENKRLPSQLLPRPDLKIKKGDVLITRAGPNSRVGVVALVDIEPGKLMLSDKIYRVVPKMSLSGEFLTAAFSSAATQRDLDSYKTGLAESQTNISQAIVRRLLIPLPCLEEREIICERFRSARDCVRTTTLHLGKMLRLKNGLMLDLLSGECRY